MCKIDHAFGEGSYLKLKRSIMKPDRELDALLRLNTDPCGKQESVRIYEEAVARTLKKEEAAVATLDRLTKRSADKGDASFALELEWVIRKLNAVRSEMEATGRSEHASDIRTPIFLLDELARKLRGKPSKWDEDDGGAT